MKRIYIFGLSLFLVANFANATEYRFLEDMQSVPVKFRTEIKMEPMKTADGSQADKLVANINYFYVSPDEMILLDSRPDEKGRPVFIDSVPNERKLGCNIYYKPESHDRIKTATIAAGSKSDQWTMKYIETKATESDLQGLSGVVYRAAGNLTNSKPFKFAKLFELRNSSGKTLTMVCNDYCLSKDLSSASESRCSKVLDSSTERVLAELGASNLPSRRRFVIKSEILGSSADHQSLAEKTGAAK